MPTRLPKPRMPDPLAACSWPSIASRHATALREAVAFVLAEVDAVGVVAAGTIVRGRPHAASDLDLYVIHEAPLRRRVQRLFGERVPTEIFINPPAAVRAYFIAEHEGGRPVTAHMLATGHVVLSRHPVVEALRREAAEWLARPSAPSAPALLRARYDAATRFEDAVDVACDDPATAAMLLGGAVTAMLETWCRTRLGAIPRGKDLLAQVTALDAGLGAAAREVFGDGPLSRRLAAAERVADHTVAARGFFEWDSGAEPVPERAASG